VKEVAAAAQPAGLLVSRSRFRSLGCRHGRISSRNLEQNRVVEAIVAGASGYILKTAPPKAIISAVRATAAGESVISSQIAGKLLQRIRERDIPVTTASDNAASAIRSVLTERELEIFERLASGRSNHDIAHELSLSTNTVHNHIASILAKLHLDNRIQAAVQAVRSGIS
jgi:DNA-binding NarL/FixJ family response regulator